MGSVTTERQVNLPIADSQTLSKVGHALDFPRVLLVGPDFTGGGGERHFANLSRYLFQGTCDVCVLKNSLRDNPAWLQTQNFIDTGWMNRWCYPRIIRQIREALSNKEYDCCLGFGLFPSMVLFMASRGMDTPPPVISMEITRPIEAMKQSVWYRRILYSQIQRIVYGRSDRFAANSIDGVLEAVSKLGVNTHKTQKVPNIVEAGIIHNEKSKPNPSPYTSKQPYFVCLARLVNLKRVDNVIEAFAKIVKSLNISLVILGDGPEKAQLMALAKSLGVYERITFSGHISNPYPVMHGAAGFVSASEYEGISNSILEAMFCDVPVITSFCSSDTREMCDQGAALGFEVGDYKHLAEHIVAVVTDDVLSQELVERAQEYRAPHAMERAIPAYEDLIRQVAGHKGTNR